ncbi:hypothetical protein AWB80_05550 [Caballeronia pedi]|uniref:Toxin VasX N-terminal region domain-containing protein n=1 Tax=Caballeronia pedi TaxID=1777141 RepID=A0A158CQC7_9BURK|nr:toxin VasX [Caballeronia pedi]SAK83807.1 hypothetical protein AWB80_05550 [Caballeronia pedi]
MADNFKKALQPPHPGEKQVGKAISPPPCQRGIPIYPLRYGITDHPLDTKLFPKLTTAGYPALQGGKAYGLRVLRPGCYVYLCYMKDGRMWTQHYRVTADVRFAPIWWTEADDKDAAPGRLATPDETVAQPWLLAPEEKTATTVYLLVTDTVLTHRTLYKIETNQGGLRDKLATQVKPAGGDQQAHTFRAILAGNATVELIKPAISGTPYGYSWSEVKPEKEMADNNRIVGGMYTMLLPRKDVIPLAVALQDTIGIASELGYLCSLAVKDKDAFQTQNKHKLQSAALIDTYFKQAEASPDGKSQDGLDAIRRQKNMVDLNGARAFKSTHDQKLKNFDPPIRKTGADVVAWMRLLDDSKLLGTALRSFDLSCVRNAMDYEIAVLNCIGASVHTDDGLHELAKLIRAEPKLSPLWKALGAGDEPLMDRLNRYLIISRAVFGAADKYVEERAATAATNILAGMVQHFVATAPVNEARIQILRLRHVSARRFNITLGYTEISAEQFAHYAMEMQGYLVMGPDVFARWKLEMSQVPGRTPGSVETQGSQRIEVWEWETIGTAAVQGAAHGHAEPIPAIGNPLLRNLKRVRDIAVVKAAPLRTPAGVGFTGIGGALAVWTMRGAVKDLSKELNGTNAVSGFGALAGLAGSAIEVTTLALSMFMARKGNEILATTIATVGFKWGTTYAGGAAAAIMAVADTIRAVNASNDGNAEQASWYLGSALAGGVVAVATFAGGQAVLTTLAAGGGEAVAVLGFTPVGWLVIAVLATAVVIYCSVKAGSSQQSPVEIWLAHSAWGAAVRHFSLSQEMEAWHSLHFRPQITTKWEAAYGNSGTLRLRCTLPGDGNGDFRAVLRASLHGQPLQRVDAETAGKATGAFNLNLDKQFVVGRLSSDYGAERGWQIGMHHEAQVEVSYLYRPDPQKMPDLGLEQPDMPKPLIFTRDGAADESRLAPVRAPA